MVSAVERHSYHSGRANEAFTAAELNEFSEFNYAIDSIFLFVRVNSVYHETG
jgi:hypothetical protein